MSGYILKEASCLRRLLGLTLTPVHEWNAYIYDVAKDDGRIVDSLYRSRKCLTVAAILYLYKRQTRQRLAYSYHIWIGVAQSSLFSLDRVKKNAYTALWVMN